MNAKLNKVPHNQRTACKSRPVSRKESIHVAGAGGVVDAIYVSVGQAVNEGDKLVSLEAMKMVTHIVASSAGKIVNITVKPGEPVRSGQALLTIG